MKNAYTIVVPQNKSLIFWSKKMLNQILDYVNSIKSSKYPKEKDANITADIEFAAYKKLSEIIEKWIIDTCSRLRNDIRTSKKWAVVHFILTIAMLVSGIILWRDMCTFITGNPKMDISAYILLRLSSFISLGLGTILFYRQYKNQMSNKKYLQNELTVIEAKYRVWQYSTIINDKDSIRKAMSEMFKIHKMNTLEKDQTTVELEQKKLDDNLDNQIINSMLQMVKKDNKN